MSIVLRHRVEASEHAASEIEREIESEGHEISLCYDVEEFLKDLVAEATSLIEFVEAGQNSAKNHQPYFDAEKIRWIDAMYRRIEATFARAHLICKRVEAFSGSPIQGQEKFHLAWSQLRGIVCFSLDSVMLASSQAARGEGCGLTEFMDELLH